MKNYCSDISSVGIILLIEGKPMYAHAGYRLDGLLLGLNQLSQFL